MQPSQRQGIAHDTFFTGPIDIVGRRPHQLEFVTPSLLKIGKTSYIDGPEEALDSIAAKVSDLHAQARAASIDKPDQLPRLLKGLTLFKALTGHSYSPQPEAEDVLEHLMGGFHVGGPT